MAVRADRRLAGAVLQRFAEVTAGGRRPFPGKFRQRRVGADERTDDEEEEEEDFFTVQIQDLDNSFVDPEGRLRLRQTGRYLSVPHGRTTNKLFETQPVVKARGEAGLAVTTPQRCNDIAAEVAGDTGDEMGQAHFILAEVLSEVTGDDAWLRGMKVVREGFKNGAERRRILTFLSDLSAAYQRAAKTSSERLAAALERRRLNAAQDDALRRRPAVLLAYVRARGAGAVLPRAPTRQRGLRRRDRDVPGAPVLAQRTPAP